MCNWGILIWAFNDFFFFDAPWYWLCWFIKSGWCIAPKRWYRHGLIIYDQFKVIGILPTHVLHFHSIFFIPKGAVDSFHCLYIHNYQVTHTKHTSTYKHIYIYTIFKLISSYVSAHLFRHLKVCLCVNVSFKSTHPFPDSAKRTPWFSAI